MDILKSSLLCAAIERYCLLMNDSVSSTIHFTLREDRRTDVEGTKDPNATCVSGILKVGAVSSTKNPLDEDSEYKPVEGKRT